MTSTTTPTPEAPYTVAELLQEPWLPVHRLPSQTTAFRTGRGIEVMGYRAVSALLRRTDLGTGLPDLFTASAVQDQELLDLATASVNAVEGKHHVRLRSAIGSFFTPDRVARMRGEIRALADELITTSIVDDRLDLAHDLVRHVPTTLFARLLGVPDGDAAFIGRISAEAIAVFSMDPELASDVVTSWQEMSTWVDELLATHDGTGDDLVAHLRAAQRAGTLDEAEVHNAVVTLLAASADTTQILAGCMFRCLLDDPEQWQLLRARPDLVPAAVVEAARHRPGDAWIFRVALQDTEIEGLPVAAGEHVFALVAAANRDPDTFERPDDFWIERPDQRAPLNWGVGRHFCMGRMFAVMELEEMLRSALEHFSHIAHADPLGSSQDYYQVQHTLPVRVRTA